MKNNAFQFVVVLYQQVWEKTAVAQPLTTFFQTHSENDLLIVDNSPVAQSIPATKLTNVSYLHHPENPGLAQAYNEGLKAATTNHHKWLVLLDQDTSITEDYLLAISQYQDTENDIVSLVPQMLAQQRQISPLLADKYIDRDWQYPAVGKTNKRLMAINSASVWRVAFLVQIGGFNLDFPLDFLDHWLFYQVSSYQKKVEVVPVILHHDLSVLHYQTMTITRYQSILTAEERYYRSIEPTKKARHLKQLQRRTLKQFLTVRNRKLWRATWKSYQNMRRTRR